MCSLLEGKWPPRFKGKMGEKGSVFLTSEAGGQGEGKKTRPALDRSGKGNVLRRGKEKAVFRGEGGGGSRSKKKSEGRNMDLSPSIIREEWSDALGVRWGERNIQKIHYLGDR